MFDLTVHAILSWQQPLQTLPIFFTLFLFTFLIRFGGYTLLTLLSYLFLLQITTCFLFVNGTQLILKIKGQTQSQRDETYKQYITYEMIEPYVPEVISLGNKVVNMLIKIMRCRDNVLTLKVSS